MHKIYSYTLIEDDMYDFYDIYDSVSYYGRELDDYLQYHLSICEHDKCDADFNENEYIANHLNTNCITEKILEQTIFKQYIFDDFNDTYGVKYRRRHPKMK